MSNLGLRGRRILTITGLLFLAACGGGGGSSVSSTPTLTVNGPNTDIPSPTTDTQTVIPTPENVIAVSVALGPSGPGLFFPNQSFVSLQLCQPNSSNCVTIDKVLLDTGSFGLRVFDSALAGLSLNASTYQSRTLYQCAVFGSGYTQGPVRVADMKLGTLKAPNLPLQVIEAGPRTVPSGCSQSGVGPITAPEQLGANGILGVGALADDSGPLLVYYFVMQGAQASLINGLPSTLRIPQPITRLEKHNNGLILNYPAVDLSGAPTLDAQLILGLGTSDNNTTTGATFFTLSNSGRLRMAFNGTPYDGVIDSGANHYVFPYAYLPNCGGTVFFCPETPQTVHVAIGSYGATPRWISTLNLLDYKTYGSNAAQPGLAGYTTGNNEFILGLPFFYGRKVFIAVQGQSLSLIHI